MTARKEFEEHVGTKPILCAEIGIRNNGQGYYNFTGLTEDHRLPTGWDQAELEEFLESIDKEYERVSGCIWYEDKTVSYRHQNPEGAVWRHTEWEIPPVQIPIPKHLIRPDRMRDKTIDAILS